MDWSKLTSLSFWFDLAPGSYSQFVMSTLLVLFALTFVVGIAGKVSSEKRRAVDKLAARVYRKIGNLGIAMGIVGFALLFFYYEGIYIFSARFWFVVWLLATLYWIRRIVYLARVKIPREKKTMEEQSDYEKYLPKPNKG